jgi:hypothetical protein
MLIVMLLLYHGVFRAKSIAPVTFSSTIAPHRAAAGRVARRLVPQRRTPHQTDVFHVLGITGDPQRENARSKRETDLKKS